MAKSEHISIRIESEIKEQLIRIADSQGRKHTNLAAHIIREWVKQHQSIKINPNGLIDEMHARNSYKPVETPSEDTTTITRHRAERILNHLKEYCEDSDTEKQRAINGDIITLMDALE